MIFPSRDPFNSDINDSIRKMIEAGNPSQNSNDLIIDQTMEDDTLIVTADISKYSKESVRLSTKTQNNVSYLTFNVISTDNTQMTQETIQLVTMVDDSTAKATENNGVLTIEFDIVDSGNSIEIE